MAAHFQTSLAEIQKQIEQHSARNEKLCEDNAKLSQKLHSLLEQCQRREEVRCPDHSVRAAAAAPDPACPRVRAEFGEDGPPPRPPTAADFGQAGSGQRAAGGRAAEAPTRERTRERPLAARRPPSLGASVTLCLAAAGRGGGQNPEVLYHEGGGAEHEEEGNARARTSALFRAQVKTRGWKVAGARRLAHSFWVGSGGGGGGGYHGTPGEFGASGNGAVHLGTSRVHSCRQHTHSRPVECLRYRMLPAEVALPCKTNKEEDSRAMARSFEKPTLHFGRFGALNSDRCGLPTELAC